MSQSMTIQQLVETISQEHFQRPFRHMAFFNPRLRTTGGRYMLQSHNIELNKKYYDEHGYDELVGIIKHELCHYHLHIEGKGYQHRDRDFKELCQKVGAPRFCTPLQSEVQKRRARPAVVYIYECGSCGQQYPRKRRINTERYRCSLCGGKLK